MRECFVGIISAAVDGSRCLPAVVSSRASFSLARSLGPGPARLVWLGRSAVHRLIARARAWVDIVGRDSFPTNSRPVTVIVNGLVAIVGTRSAEQLDLHWPDPFGDIDSSPAPSRTY